MRQKVIVEIIQPEYSEQRYQANSKMKILYDVSIAIVYACRVTGLDLL